MAKKRKYESPEESPGVLLWQISHSWQKNISNALESIGLTHVQFVLLSGLLYYQNKNEETTQTKLATFTKTDVMMTSQVLRKLESKGYLKRKSHESDSRAKKIMLTKKGTDVVEDAMKIVEEVDNGFFEKVSKDVDKLSNILSTLKKED